MVFPEVNCLGGHAEGSQRVLGRSGIMPSTGMSANARDFGLVRRHGGLSVVVGGAFERGWR